MVQLIFLLLGVEYLQKRANAIRIIGLIWVIAGIAIFIDALDNAIYFPIQFFAWLFLIEGLATLAVAWTGVGGQRMLRYFKGSIVVLASILIFAGSHNGNFLLSMLLGALFMLDGVLQCISSWIVRYRRWKVALLWGIFEILIAIFFFQPYPTHYVGTLPYGLGIFLIFGGIHLLTLSSRVRRLDRVSISNAGNNINSSGINFSEGVGKIEKKEWNGPPCDNEHALVVHVWTPTGSSKAPTQSYPLIDRYIAAVDVNGVISTGHAALESPEGIYISLYPGVEIDRSPDEFGRILRATAENDVPGVFQPDYATESKAWCPSTVQVKIRNYDPSKLKEFWENYKLKKIYNLTHRNCSSSVSNALEAAIDGAVFRLHGPRAGWLSLLRILVTPELWVAAQIRKRAVTMAWTPGLTLDYARALSMLADPRPFGWARIARGAAILISNIIESWRSNKFR
ncbi:HdeD family acid-resistance protein [Comamonas sp. 4034]|uniref:HdeD family acid-resistance protein n=1 Tax=Comamonas sp. 4034 TaxID=3156455 RepID=UPI003D1E1307